MIDLDLACGHICFCA